MSAVKPATNRTALPITKGRTSIVVDDLGDRWVLWLHTADYRYGTRAELHHDGRIEVITEERDGIDARSLKPKRD